MATNVGQLLHCGDGRHFQLLVADPANVGQCDSKSAQGLMSWMVRRGLARVGAHHPSFAWAASWSATLSPESGGRSRNAPSSDPLSLQGAALWARSRGGPAPVRLEADEARWQALLLADLAIKSVMVTRVSSMLHAVLAQAAGGAASEADDDQSLALIYW